VRGLFHAVRFFRAVRLTIVGVIAMVLICVWGCSAGSRQATVVTLTPPAVGSAPAPVLLSAAESALPLVFYEPTVREEQTIIRAQEVIQTRCMAERGYSGFTSAPALGNPMTYPGGGGPFGYVNARYASERGFHAPAHAVAAASKGDGMTLTEARVSLACAFQAQKEITPWTAAGAKLVERLVEESAQYAMRDARVRAATRAWVVCMKTDRFDESDPESLALARWPRAPSATEISTARADAACTSSTDLAGIYFGVLAGYQQELIEVNGGGLGAVRKEIQSDATKATQIVASDR
jgi:hypothetical protein